MNNDDDFSRAKIDERRERRGGNYDCAPSASESEKSSVKLHKWRGNVAKSYMKCFLLQ